MRHFFAILTTVLLSTLSADAQSLRLRERMPDVNVMSEYGSKLEYVERDMVCLIFVNSYCIPCIEAVQKIDRTLLDKMNIILLTTESKEYHAEIVERIGAEDLAIAYDIDSKTHKAFGINYIPFAVVYSAKRKIVEWFGPVEQLGNDILERINVGYK